MTNFLVHITFINVYMYGSFFVIKCREYHVGVEQFNYTSSIKILQNEHSCVIIKTKHQYEI